MPAVKEKKSKKSSELKAAAEPARERFQIPGVTVQSEAQDACSLDLIHDATDHNFAPLDDRAFSELVQSIASIGLLQPIVVTKFGVPEGERWYRLVCGSQRVRAARHLKLPLVPYVEIEVPDEAALIAVRTAENIHRRPPSPIDEAVLVAHVVKTFHAQATLGPTALPPEGDQDNLPVPMQLSTEGMRKAYAKAAQYFGRPEQWVRDRAFLARLDEDAQQLVIAGRLPLSHAREIAKLADPALRAELAKEAASNPDGHGYTRREFPMPIHELKQLVSGKLFSLAQAPWKLDVPFAGAPACVDCPNNSANVPGLFDPGVSFAASAEEGRRKHGGRGTQEPVKGVCTLHTCYSTKSGVTNRAIQTAGNRGAKAYRELAKSDRPKKPGATLAHLTPVYVPHAAVSAAIERKLDAPVSRPSASAPASKQRSEADVAQDKAHHQWERARYDAFMDEMDAWIGAVTGRRAAMMLAARSEAWWQLEYNSKEKPAAIKRLKAMMKIVAAPGPQFTAMDDELGKSLAALEDGVPSPSAIFDILAEAAGIKVEPHLTLDQFKRKQAGAGSASSAVSKAEQSTNVSGSEASGARKGRSKKTRDPEAEQSALARAGGLGSDHDDGEDRGDE